MTKPVLNLYTRVKLREKLKFLGKKKKKQWFQKGKLSYDGVIQVPMTPHSTLAKRVRKRLRQNKNIPFNLLVQERGGYPIKKLVVNGNQPYKLNKCGRDKCMVCPNKEGDCWKQGTTYEIECLKCEKMGHQFIYFGECSCGLHFRSVEHVDKYLSRKKDSPRFKHHKDTHKDDELDWMMWRMTCTASYTKPTPRQVAEGLHIAEGLARERESKRERGGNTTVLNSRGDFRQPGVISTQARGLSQDLKFT